MGGEGRLTRPEDDLPALELTTSTAALPLVLSSSSSGIYGISLDVSHIECLEPLAVIFCTAPTIAVISSGVMAASKSNQANTALSNTTSIKNRTQVIMVVSDEDKCIFERGQKACDRLEVQAQIIQSLAEEYLDKAGLAAGMIVSDIGCKNGAVTEYLAHMYGWS